MHRFITAGVVGGALTLVLWINGIVSTASFFIWVAAIAAVAAAWVWIGDKARWPINFMSFSLGALLMVVGWAMSFHDQSMFLIAPVTVIGTGVVATNLTRVIFALLTLDWRRD